MISNAVLGDDDRQFVFLIKSFERIFNIRRTHVPAEVTDFDVRVMNTVAINPIAKVIVYAEKVAVLNDFPEEVIILHILQDCRASMTEPCSITCVRIC
ncbi:hypothetical protein D3C73_1227610 [compost metagenome]